MRCQLVVLNGMEVCSYRQLHHGCYCKPSAEQHAMLIRALRVASASSCSTGLRVSRNVVHRCACTLHTHTSSVRCTLTPAATPHLCSRQARLQDRGHALRPHWHRLDRPRLGLEPD